MFLLHARLLPLFFVSICLLLLNSCASVNGGGTTSPQNDAWKDVPKPYIAGLKAAKKGRSKQAIKLLKQSTEDYPTFSPAYTNLGLQQLKLKDHPAAKISFKKSIEINSHNPVVYNHLGVIARMDGDFNTAQTMYNKAIQQNPDYAIAHLNLGILLDLYLYNLEPALQHYETYQSLQDKKDISVTRWIVDLKRRLAKNKK